nr:hypothetical protein CFP56_28106 [Quercus suber]
MKLLDQLVTAFFLFLASHLLLTGSVATNQVILYVHNKCLFPIWPATAPNTGYPVIADGGFYLPSGQTQHKLKDANSRQEEKINELDDAKLRREEKIDELEDLNLR